MTPQPVRVPAVLAGVLGHVAGAADPEWAVPLLVVALGRRVGRGPRPRAPHAHRQHARQDHAASDTLPPLDAGMGASVTRSD